MAKPKDYQTTRDIVIPAGTIIGRPPTRSSRWGSDFEGLVALDKDHTAYVSFDVEEGLEAGVIEKLPDA